MGYPLGLRRGLADPMRTPGPGAKPKLHTKAADAYTLIQANTFHAVLLALEHKQMVTKIAAV
jgi:hypothetical protein